MTTNNSILPNTKAGRELPKSPLAKLAYAAIVLTAAVLAATGLGTFVLGKAPMTHWILMLHVSAAPLFALGLAVLSLTWVQSPHADHGTAENRRVAGMLFWLVLIGGLVLIVSGILPMTPLFGTDGQRQFYVIHRYGGFALILVVLLHLAGLARRNGGTGRPSGG